MCRKYLSSLSVSFLTIAALMVLGSDAGATLIDVRTLLDDDQTSIDLSSAVVTVSSTKSASFPKSRLVDNYSCDLAEDQSFIWGDTDTNQRLSISGFSGAFDTIRIFSAPNDAWRVLGTLQVKASTTSTSSLNPADYELDLGTFAASGRTYHAYISGVSADARGYFDLSVSAPIGTRSLFVGAGSADDGVTGLHGDRIHELQAIVTVPEPSVLVLLCCGVVGLLCYAWRKRR